jgi:hypothetical protein
VGIVLVAAFVGLRLVGFAAAFGAGPTPVFVVVWVLLFGTSAIVAVRRQRRRWRTRGRRDAMAGRELPWQQVPGTVVLDDQSGVATAGTLTVSYGVLRLQPLSLGTVVPPALEVHAGDGSVAFATGADGRGLGVRDCRGGLHWFLGAVSGRGLLTPLALAGITVDWATYPAPSALPDGVSPAQ